MMSDGYGGWFHHLKIRLALWLLKGEEHQTRCFSNRWTRWFMFLSHGIKYITVEVKDGQQEDGYSHGELLEMQELVWRHAFRQGIEITRLEKTNRGTLRVVAQ